MYGFPTKIRREMGQIFYTRYKNIYRLLGIITVNEDIQIMYRAQDTHMGL
jgi:hypothetical protein